MNVVITGASKGIGKAIAQQFAAAGAKLFLCARNAGPLTATVNELKALYPNASFQSFTADLSVQQQVEDFASFCLSHGTPDVIINNAGSYVPGNIIDETPGTLESMLSVNLLSAYHLTRKLLPSMIQNKHGHIFNMCSIAGLKAYPGGGSYSISKFALNGFNQNLRQELMPHGIKVTGIFPGAVLTDSWGDYDNTTKRIMEPSDIATMVYAATQLSAQAVVEDIVIRPLLGDL
jgi:short-subunit dehydrogenase